MRLVVAAVLRRGDAVLACRRTRPEALAGCWEFPGGKVEPGERPEAALTRELREELGIGVCLGAELLSSWGTWPISSQLEMRVWWATSTDEPAPGESHDRIQWVTSVTDLVRIEWVPADLAIAQLVADRLNSGS